MVIDFCYILPQDQIMFELISTTAQCTNLNLEHYKFRLSK